MCCAVACGDDAGRRRRVTPTPGASMHALVRRDRMQAPSEASAANSRRPRRGSPPRARRNRPAATAWRGPIPDGGSASSFHGPPPHRLQRGPPPARAAPARRRSPPRASPPRPSPAPLAGRRSDRIAPRVEMGGRDGRGGGPRDQRREHQHPGLADQGGCRCVLAAASSRKGKMHARRPHTGAHGLADERRASGDGDLHPTWGPTARPPPVHRICCAPRVAVIGTRAAATIAEQPVILVINPRDQRGPRGLRRRRRPRRRAVFPGKRPAWQGPSPFATRQNPRPDARIAAGGPGRRRVRADRRIEGEDARTGP